MSVQRRVWEAAVLEGFFFGVSKGMREMGRWFSLIGECLSMLVWVAAVSKVNFSAGVFAGAGCYLASDLSWDIAHLI